MADITSFQSGSVNESGKMNWRGDQVSVPIGQNVYETSSVQLAPLGSRLVVGDRSFRYARSGATIGAGLCVEVGNSVTAASHAQVTGANATKGDKTITVTAETTAPANIFAEGYLAVHSGTAANQGYMYRVKNHAAIASAGTGVLYLYDEITQPIITADQLTILANKYQTVLKVTAAGDICVGVTPVAVVSSDYFWLQTNGPACVKAAAATESDPMTAGATGQAEAFNVSLSIPISGSASGKAVTFTGTLLAAASTAGTISFNTDAMQIIGHAMQALTNSTYGLINLCVEP